MPDYPEFQRPKEYGYGVDNVDNGQALLSDIRSRMNMGLPEDVKQRYYRQILGQISGNKTAGKQAINQNFANSGLTGGAKLGALSDLYSNANEQLIQGQDNIANLDFQAQQQNYQQGMGNQFQLLGLGANIGQNRNSNALQLSGQYNNYLQNQYKNEQDNSFSFGKLLGGLFSLGGSIGGAMLGMPQVGGLLGRGAGRAIGG